ncbi:MAG: aldo/keto reductase [Solirubrobacteraceae bacterium]
MTETTFLLGGRPIHRMGFGAMQLPGPGVWGPAPDRDEAIAVLRRAVQRGVDHIDTAQFYGPDVANELIHAALHPYPDRVRIATKVGFVRGDDRSWQAAQRPEQLRDQVEANLRSLAVDRLALVNLRVPNSGPDGFDEALGTLADLRTEGKIELIGLSNVGVSDLEHALSLTEIAGVQNSFNLLERGNADVLEACGDRGLAFVPFFPLGSAFGEGHGRIADQPAVQRIAAKHDATPAQVALAWLWQLAPNILLIPGTSSLSHLEENLAAAELTLGDEDLEALEALA